MRFSSGRQRNPTRPTRHHRRQAFPFLDQILDPGVRSPRRRRASSVSLLSLEEMKRLCNELEASGNIQSQRSAPDLGMLGSDLDANMIVDSTSPMPSEPASPASPMSPFFSMPQPSPSPSPSPFHVKDGDMIRLTLETRTNKVPCIAKCCLGQRASVADEDFVRNWAIIHHPMPKKRWGTRGTEPFCTLDVIDVEKVGSIKILLNMSMSNFQDRRFSVALGVDALASLGLVENAGKCLVDATAGSSRLGANPLAAGPRSTPDPGHASVNINPWPQPDTWPRGLAASTSPISPEPQRPPLNLFLQIPKINIDSSRLDPTGGSTSADDSGSNSDMFSMGSFGDGAWSPAPSSEFDMERTLQYD